MVKSHINKKDPDIAGISLLSHMYFFFSNIPATKYHFTKEKSAEQINMSCILLTTLLNQTKKIKYVITTF